MRYPDLIFLDIEMPGLTGPEMAYRLLIEDAGRENIPIIILSGVADLEEVVAEVGTPYFIAKPYRLDDLEAVLGRALKERQPPRRKRAA
jgi:FixJ family two-component response regulator